MELQKKVHLLKDECDAAEKECVQLGDKITRVLCKNKHMFSGWIAFDDSCPIPNFLLSFSCDLLI